MSIFGTGAVDIVAGYPDEIGMAGKQFGLYGKAVGEPFVVGIEEGDPVAGCGVDAGVAGGGGSCVGLRDEAYTGAGGGDDLDCVVGGAVIDDDNLAGGIGLGQDAVNGPPDVGGAVVGRNDSTNGKRLVLSIIVHAGLLYRRSPKNK